MRREGAYLLWRKEGLMATRGKDGSKLEEARSMAIPRSQFPAQ